MSWRDHLPIHPAALLLPRPTEEEARDLAADIGKHGIRVPIVILVVPSGILGIAAGRYLLDGISRLDGLERNGREVVAGRGQLHAAIPQTEIRLTKDFDPIGFVLSLNAHRRHLTREQREQLIAARIKANPERSDRQVAKEIGTSHDTVTRTRKKLERRDAVATRRTVTDTKGRKQPATKQLRLRVKQETLRVPVVGTVEPAKQAVTIRRPPVCSDPAADVPREQWPDLMCERRNFFLHRDHPGRLPPAAQDHRGRRRQRLSRPWIARSVPEQWSRHQ